MSATQADLLQRLEQDGRTLATVGGWVAARVAADWSSSWQRQLPTLTDAWERIGEPAYGLYNRELFRPIQQDLETEGFRCDPALPGSMRQSEEDWGREDHRERRMWTVLVDRDGTELGALVVRFFHDHTELRLPAGPTMAALPETDHDAIREIVRQEPDTWAIV